LGVGPGFDCWNPIPISLPSQLPYSNTNTTCGKINYYTETCLGSYDQGQDILYELYVFAPMIVDFGLTSNASWVGMCIDENCPPDLSCINMCTSSGSSCSMLGVSLSTGIYYLMIDTWPDPDCIPQFTLTITPACSQLSGSLLGTLNADFYCVVGDIWVNSGDLLTLQPGTTFRFDGPYSFRVLGTLSAIGTANDSIVFTTEQTGENRWRGLRFFSGSSGSQLAYCLIEKGYATGNFPDAAGGGVYCSDTWVNFTNCTISDNEATWGGGASCNYYPAPSFTSCRFSDNSASVEGGGIYCFYSSPSLTKCTMSGNSAGHGGGGAYCFFYTSPTFTNCLFTGNSASWGGGLQCAPFSSPSFTNCTVSGNSAPLYGGVLCDSCSTPIITSMVIAFSTGSGIGFYRSPGSQIQYCDLYGNSGGNIEFYNGDPSHGPPGIGQLTNTNANGDPCDIYRNIFLDPLFVNGPGGDFHLTNASHCIGAGDPYSPLTTDFEGDPRPNPPGTNPDIGIDEHWLGCPVGRLVITMASGNAVLYWPYFAYTVNIYGATAPYTAGTLITTVYGVTTWTDFQTSSRPSPYFYYVKAAQ
jgi:predicted outer membrane repeat protein